MSSPIYYFINHSRNEFCCFDKNYPIFEELVNAMKWNKGWILEDNICIDSELPGSTVLIEFLMDILKYKDLDHENSDEDSVPDSVA
jgi:hypothetical protein